MRKNDVNTPVAVGLIVCLNLVVFSGKLSGRFLSDDFLLLSKISNVTFSIKGLCSLFITRQYQNTILFHVFSRPVPLLIWALLYRLFHLSPAYYHATILLFHIVNCILLFVIVSKLVSRPVGLIAASMFAVFPGHLQAVQWLACFFDISCTLFFLASLLFLILFLEKNRALYYAASLVSGALALFSKESAIALPFVAGAILLYRLWEENDRRKRNIRVLKLCAPYLLLVIAFGIMEVTMVPAYWMSHRTYGSFLNPMNVIGYAYLWKNLAIPFFGGDLLKFASTAAIGGLVLTLLMALFIEPESRKPMVFAFSWIIFSGFPVVSLVKRDFFFDRMNYLPAIGFCLLLGAVSVNSPGAGRKRKLFSLLPCLLIALYSASTLSYTARYWKRAWLLSAKVQESFQEDVAPAIKKPARVFFFHAPEMADAIPVFFAGLPEACRLWEHSGDVYYNLVSQYTEVVPPLVEDPETVTVDTRDAYYYFLLWNPERQRFQIDDDVVKGAGGVGKAGGLRSWDFSNPVDALQWEPTDQMASLPDMRAAPNTFLTIGEYSLLKSPFLRNRRISYVQISCILKNPKILRENAQLFWVTDADLDYNGEKSVRFSVKNDGLFHTYTIPMYFNYRSVGNPLRRIAVRFSSHPQTLVKVKSIKMYCY